MNNLIDELYGGFTSSLPSDLQPLARALPHVLGLAPTPGAHWSEVFSHPVTLAAPSLVAEALPRAGPELVRRAVLAHALSVIEAFGHDRVADGQVRRSPELHALLEHLRTARDSVLERIQPGAARLARAADQETRDAIADEHELLSRVGAATFGDYHRLSLAKQAVGFPASVALATASGATESQLEEIKRTLRGVWLGLQFEDDAVDWEDDWRRGHGAWAVSLARRKLEAVREQRPDDPPTQPDMIRRRVFGMRILYSLLRLSRHQYHSAWRYSRILGASRLGQWAEERKARTDELLPLEDKHAGYVVRSRKLAAWAAEVLS
jgi:hypothetical protein